MELSKHASAMWKAVAEVAEEDLDIQESQECIKDVTDHTVNKPRKYIVGHFLLKDFQNRAIFSLVTIN